MSQLDDSSDQKTRAVTPEHKAAMSQGRTETRIVRHYLEALAGVKQGGGRRRSKDTLEKKLTAVEAELATADPVSRLHLVQQRLDLAKALEAADQTIDMEQLESDFVSVAASYSDRKGISYQAWREVGVDARVLRTAGIR